jgi:hypothetical protein
MNAKSRGALHGFIMPMGVMQSWGHLILLDPLDAGLDGLLTCKWHLFGLTPGLPLTSMAGLGKQVFDVPAEDILNKPELMNLASRESVDSIGGSELGEPEDGSLQVMEAQSRSNSETVKTPCGAQLSAVTGTVTGQVSGHYVEGVSTVADLEQALTSAFLRTDAEFNATGISDHIGTTAVCCLVGSRCLFRLNVFRFLSQSLA